MTPAVVASNTCSYWPAYRLTSVEVPGGDRSQEDDKKSIKVSKSKTTEILRTLIFAFCLSSGTETTNPSKKLEI